MPTIEEYQTLLREAEEKRAKVTELEEALARLQEELAILKGEKLPPVAAKVPWYKSWKTYLALGGLVTLITGIAISKSKSKEKSTTPP